MRVSRYNVTKAFTLCDYLHFDLAADIIFCKDAETASSAVRNLNGYELGGRQLRVDYADMDPAIEAQRQRERQHDVCIC